MRRFAALDYGSNTTVLLLAREEVDGTLVHEQERFATTRLGADFDQTKRLRKAAIDATLEATAGFLENIPRDLPVLGIAAGTSAVREAANRSDFLNAAQALLGKQPILLSGDDEARTTFRGAVSDQPARLRLVNIDIGGGSTEIGAGDRDVCQIATSIHVGCVRLTEQFDLQRATDAATLRDARRHARQCLEPARDILPRRDPRAAAAVRLVATGGTATTFAAYRRKLPKYDRRRIHGYRVQPGVIDEVLPRLASLPAALRSRMPGIPPDRAAILPAGLIVLAEFLDLFQPRECLVSTRGLRYGLACCLQSGELPPTWEWSSD